MRHQLSAVCGTLVGALALMAPHAGNTVAAEPDSAGQQIERHLAAGEFAPALRLAERASGEDRDVHLNQIAAAQAAGGESHAARRTLSRMRQSASFDGSAAEAPALPLGAQGGSQADFDSLIELITTTVQPSTWEEVGGTGAIDSFEGGVYVDPKGLMRRIAVTDQAPRLTSLRRAASPGVGRAARFNSRKASPLRKISLTRLERTIALRRAAGLPPTEEMRLLAGLEQIKYVLVYPESGDIVLAGPASDWRRDAEGRIVSTETARPLVQLDDLVVLLRHMNQDGETKFGCSITPHQEALAATKAYLETTGAKPLAIGGRDKWLIGLRDTLGEQAIEFYGVDPRTRVGRVMIEADYHMKLVGMGLEEPVLGVESYLDALARQHPNDPPPMDVLRWWFTLNERNVLVSPDRNAFELRGPSVKVLSENELLTDLGKRVHTGKSSTLNEQFAHQFTKEYEALAAKYPVYAELQNVFDLAIVAAVIKQERLAERAGWHMNGFTSTEQYEVPLSAAPTSVQTVINHRVVGKTRIIAGVSGGVSVDAGKHVSEGRMKTDEYGLVAAEHVAASPEKVDVESWWWD